jgi:Ca2+-dependent lipid-binding protein
MDPYCIFEFTHKTKGAIQTLKTKVLEAAGKNPIWNEKFTVLVDLPPAEVGNGGFTFKIYDEDPSGKSEIVGESASVPIKDLMDKITKENELVN